MFKHYLTTALRHFRQHKTTTLINVLCLSFGFVSFALAFGFVRYFNYADSYHENAGRTYVLTQRNIFIDANSTLAMQPYSGSLIAAALKTDHPELAIVARAIRNAEMPVVADEGQGYATVAFADADFLRVFDLSFLAGDKREALTSPRSALISESLALELFGRTDVIGKALLIMNRETVHITGVLKAQPQPSHISTTHAFSPLQFKLLVSTDTWDALVAAMDRGPQTPYFDGKAITYVVLPALGGPTVERLRNDLKRFSEQHIPPQYGRAEFDLRPVSEVFASGVDFLLKTETTGISITALLLTLGIMVLIVSCLNYANLASAQVTTHLKELALRRVVGASRSQIVIQSLLEAFFVAFLSACISLALLSIFLAAIRTTVGVDIGSALYGSVAFWITLGTAILVVAMFACSYPALVATRIRPANALQSGRLPITKRRAMLILVVCQFSAASLLFVVTSVMNSQNERIKRNQISVNDDPIVVIENNLKDAGIDANTLQNKLRNHDFIKSVSAINASPGTMQIPNWIMRGSKDPASRSWIMQLPIIDHEFLSTMGIQLLAGRDFDRNVAGDLSTGRYGDVIIDRALAADYGWANPQAAIGQQVFFPRGAAKDAAPIPVTVIGVAENAKLYPISLFGHTSTAYLLDPTRVSTLLIRVDKKQIPASLRAIDEVWKELTPNVPIKRKFLDEQYDALYKNISAITTVFRTIAIFALVIGAMGLVGISTHAIAQRKFEIGVRRTLGASVRQVLTMLLKDFSKPILYANLIAWPFAFVIAKGYGVFFTDKVAITFTPFAGTLLLGLVIAWVAVLKQATSASLVSPAQTLRHE